MEKTYLDRKLSDRRTFLQQSSTAVTAGVFLSQTAGAASPQEAALTRGGEAQASIVVGQDSGKFYRWVAEELQRYVRLLSGAELPIVPTAESHPQGTRILLGGPESNELTRKAQQKKLVDFSVLKKDGFLLHSINLDSQPTLVVGGNDEVSTMYAAYDLLERLGVVFQISGDLIPEQKPDLMLPALQVRMEPAIKYRGPHIRPVVMPWMGLDYLRKLLDQLAKMKCNYLEFYWYVGAPWIEYSYRGEKKLIGDLYPKESGYLNWRTIVSTFTTSDVEIGREHFNEQRMCTTEFQEVETPEEAYRVARQLLKQVIDYAHERKIQVWLGKGDCPVVPPNLGRHSRIGTAHYWAGIVIPPGDPSGVEIWTTAINSMIESFPEADGYWVWLSEGYFYSDDSSTQEIIRRYSEYRKLTPTLDEINKIGYIHPTTQAQIESDIGLIHYGKEIVERIKARHPSVRLGIAVLGRSYLFRALHAVMPQDVAFSSMESSAVWNPHSRVPMELFGGMGERERILIPRMDDDAMLFGMQYNIGLYERDRVIRGSVENAVAGITPQTVRIRGTEHNAKYLAEGAWNVDLTPENFYETYIRRIFGKEALQPVVNAYRILEANEEYLGWRGRHNFIGHQDNPELQVMKSFSRQENPFDGPDFGTWDIRKEVEGSSWIQACHRRKEQFDHSRQLLKKSFNYFNQAEPHILPGSKRELEYLINKTEAYILHLETVSALLKGYIAYDTAFRAKKGGNEKDLLEQFDRCEFLFYRARDRARETAKKVADWIDEPSDQYLLFRYNVRFLLPIAEFCKFIKNVVNFHHGQPYWEKVDWDVIVESPIGRR